MFFRIAIMFVLNICVLTSTCFSENLITPTEYFFQKNPSLKQNYTELNPTSYFGLALKEQEKYISKMSLLGTLKDRFENQPIILDYLTKLEEVERKNYEETKQRLEKIKNLILKNDSLYYFVYQDKKVEEIGLLLIRDGNIKWREVHVRSFK